MQRARFSPIISLVIALLIGIGDPTITAQPRSWVRIESAKGQVMMRFAPRDMPYKPGVQPVVTERLTNSNMALDAKGRVISGIGFYGWPEGDEVVVAVLILVQPNKASAESQDLRYEELATYRLVHGKPAKVKELEAAGAGIMSLRWTRQ